MDAESRREAPTINGDLVDSADLAAYLGVTRRTVKRYKARGWIHPVRRHQFAHLWDVRACVEALHERGVLEHVRLPE